MAVEGNAGSLTVTLPSDREILMTRVFDAPRELVFEAHTTPEHVRRWWGKHGTSLPVCEMDFRPGGRYRYVQREPNGVEHGFRGEYRDIAPPERLVYTFEYEGLPGHIAVETLTFDEVDGKTTLTSRMFFETTNERDGVLRSGMEGGAAQTMDRLASYLELLALER